VFAATTADGFARTITIDHRSVITLATVVALACRAPLAIRAMLIIRRGRLKASAPTSTTGVDGTRAKIGPSRFVRSGAWQVEGLPAGVGTRAVI